MYDKIVSSVAGLIGGLTTYFFGGWSMMLEFLLLLVFIDYITGVIASIKEGKGLNSQVGFMGITKKGLIFVIVAIMHRADLILETNLLMAGAIWFYVANELISIVENLGRIDFLIPPQVRNLIEILKNKGEAKENK